jgi:NapH/MauN family ferredoxin-type protein
MNDMSTKLRNALLLTGIATLLALAPTADSWADEGSHRALGLLDIWSLPRIWVGAIFCVAGLILLMRSAVRRGLRLAAVSAIFLVFGVASALPLGSFARGMGLHPSPVCAISRPFQFLHAGRGVPMIFLAVLAFVALFSVLGNKLFCGWVCPIGAVQEVFHRLPPSPRGKVRLPFKLSNWIRLGLFAVFLVVVFTTGSSIYDYFNPFEFLHWGFEAMAILALAVVLVAALFVFRPFCYLVCPIGLLTWLLEHVSVVRVRLHKVRCNGCNTCAALSPCPAVPAILQGRRSRPDCHACGRCIEVCPEKALAFRL